MANAFIRDQREQFRQELQNSTLKEEVEAMLITEDERNPIPVLESLLNRSLYLQSHGKKRTLHQMLFSGFYGPINRGQLPRAIRELRADRRLKARMDAAVNAVLDGSDMIRGHTDQGLPSDPGGAYEMAHSHVFIGGEVFGDWGGGPGGYNDAARWRQAFEEKASGAVTVPTIGDHSIENLQLALNQFGADPQLTVDGQLGPMTRQAVRDYQKAHKLTVDGKAGSQTWASIEQALTA